MARMKKRADGRYAKQIIIGHKDGKPIKKTIYGKTEKELDKKYRELMYLIDRGAVIEKGEITFKEIKNEWYRIKVEGKIKRNTECAYSSILKHTDILNDMPVKDIKRYHVESLISDILKDELENTSLSVLKMLRRIFDHAIESDIIYKNPCTGLSVKHKKEPKRVLTDNEKKILDETDIDTRDKAILYLLRYTGIRRGELFALHRNDIDEKNMTIHISKTLVDNNGKPYVQDTTKTEAGDRIIPIFLKLYKPLMDYISDKDGYLFLNKNGNFMASNSMQTWMKSAIKKYGLGSDLTMHCFRYNFISECYAAGIPLKKTQSWAGHDDVSTTLNIYTKLSREELTDGDIMNEYYASQKQVKNKMTKNKEPLSLVK